MPKIVNTTWLRRARDLQRRCSGPVSQPISWQFWQGQYREHHGIDVDGTTARRIHALHERMEDPDAV